jgi:flavin reductase (DIM6/NTAB) family NADH-FMN oxidoreductase RutF
MSLSRRLRNKLRTILLGPQTAALDFPLLSPQTTVSVWLLGLDIPFDVTTRHSVACPVPFTLCLHLPPEAHHQALTVDVLKLRFIEHPERLLGEMTLHYLNPISTTELCLTLWKVRVCNIQALSPVRRWLRTVDTARHRRTTNSTTGIPVSSLDQRCNELLFSCPRPVVMVSVQHSGNANVFPMNLMARFSTTHLVFALNTSRQASSAIITAGQLAISTIPFTHAEILRQLGRNHHHRFIDLSKLPFATHPSRTLQIPAPDFALSIRELIIDSYIPLGSHTFFIARIVDHEHLSTRPEFFRIHGLFSQQHIQQTKDIL